MLCFFSKEESLINNINPNDGKNQNENNQYKALKKDFIFSKWSKYDQNHIVARFVTSWATKEENVDALIKKLSSL